MSDRSTKLELSNNLLVSKKNKIAMTIVQNLQ
jgi:hypothetical protein